MNHVIMANHMISLTTSSTTDPTRTLTINYRRIMLNKRPFLTMRKSVELNHLKLLVKNWQDTVVGTSQTHLTVTNSQVCTIKLVLCDLPSECRNEVTQYRWFL